jgi:hypothetical protein
MDSYGGLMKNRIFISIFFLSWLALSMAEANNIYDDNIMLGLDSDTESNECNNIIEKRDILSYEGLRTLLYDGIEINDIAEIIFVYLYAREAQIRLAKCSAGMGIVGISCIGAAPFTLGMAMIIGLPFCVGCAAGAWYANDFSRLKHKARSYLKHNLLPDTYNAIFPFLKDTNKITRCLIADLIEKEGYNGSSLRNFDPKMRNIIKSIESLN